MKKLSIIIPVFNEQNSIIEIIKKVEDLTLKGIKKEIVLVDDGSTDSSAELIREYLSNNKKVKAISHKTNLGKGAAVITGIKHSTGEYIVIQDADLEYNPNDIKKLISRIDETGKIAVYGTRLNRLPNFSKDERSLLFLIQYCGNRFLSLVTSILYGEWLTDMETCYKLFPASAVLGMKLNEKGFAFEPEVTAKLLKSGYKIVEVSISTTPRNYSQGKKLQAWKDGPIALWTLLKYRFADQKNEV